MKLSVVLLILGLIGVNGNSKPNIIFFMLDDMGWNDVSYHGSNQIPTPNIDALAYESIIFRNHYVQQSCTPSRAALLTGQYPIRTGMQGFPARPTEDRQIPLNLTTMPQALKSLGYNTHLVGKWHLGFAHLNATPNAYGYDTFYGYRSGFIGYFNHEIRDFELNGIDFYDNLKPVADKQGSYLTDLLTQRSIDIIKESEEPFFLSLYHMAPHTGKSSVDLVGYLEVKNETACHEKYKNIDSELRRLYACTMDTIDESFAKIVNALEEKGILNNTIIVFLSDNGAPTVGMFENAGSNYPYRGMKLSLFEGGVRAPGFIYYKNFTQRGRIYDNLFHITDWMPTLYAAAGGNVKNLQGLDGLNQWNNFINNRNTLLRTELLVNIDEKVGVSGYLGFNGRFKYINGSFGNGIFDSYVGVEPDLSTTSEENYYRIFSQSDLGSKFASSPTKIKNIRTSMLANDCRKTMKQPPAECSGGCLFDLESDPCESRNVKYLHWLTYLILEHKVKSLQNEVAPQQNTFLDQTSNPDLCNGVWWSWKDGDEGCYYRSAQNRI